MDNITWKNEKRKISDLIPAEYNPRQLTEKQAKDLDTSLTRFNLADPIIINADNKIIGGHQRINILKQRGAVEVDVRVPSRQLTEHEEKELNLRLNKNLGEWDFDLLAGFDQEMLLDVGFDSDELDKMFQLEPDAQDDEVPEPPEEPVSKIGDIWLLGRHRVMCGDSTKMDDVERLMDGKKADMVFTDPPYGVSYGDKNKFLNSIAPGNRIQTPIENDHGSVDETGKLWVDVFTLLSQVVLGDVSSYYICSPQGGDLLQMMMMMMKAGGLPLKHMLIWAKNNHVLGRTDYNYKHEPILFGWHKTHKFYGYGDQRFSVWNYNKPLKNDLHPTMKPVELIINALLNSTERNMTVCDVFMGSGSTLIACEKTNRICYGMEIDPKYCDVIVKRWEDFTGQKAVLCGQ